MRPSPNSEIGLEEFKLRPNLSSEIAEMTEQDFVEQHCAALVYLHGHAPEKKNEVGIQTWPPNHGKQILASNSTVRIMHACRHDMHDKHESLDQILQVQPKNNALPLPTENEAGGVYEDGAFGGGCQMSSGLHVRPDFKVGDIATSTLWTCEVLVTFKGSWTCAAFHMR